MSKMVWVIVIASVAAAGIVFYLWYGDTLQDSAGQRYGEVQAPVADAGALESELQSIQTQGLDVELGDIEKELTQ